jgi:3-isopropylmalate/(R)-2-methylmalate dehydratase small subunit
MEAFRTHRGLIAALDRANVDTDQIIPKQFLKSIGRTGFGEALFYDWRYLNGQPNPAFELNQPRFRGATILVTRNNFGCGSSREHAVWALQQYGFKAIVAARLRNKDGTIVPAFADIFRNNALKNGLLLVELEEAEVETIFQMVARFRGLEATVNLEEQRLILHVPEEISFHFEIDPIVKEHLIHGLDEIGWTLQFLDDIQAFEKRHDPQIGHNP